MRGFVGNKVNLEKILTQKGLLEKERILQNVFRNEKLLKVSKVVLVSLLAAGVLTLAVTAPGVLRIFQPFIKKSRYQKRDFQKTKNILSTLKNRRLIDIEHSPEGWVLKLTEKGKERALKCYLGAFALRCKKWDGKWRVVIFDIPTKLNRKRDALRDFLRHMGFSDLQKSIYVSPYPCREEIEAIIEYLQLKSYTKFLEADFIDDQERLKDRFEITAVT